jgi:uncharacterized protein (DUF2252 family)
MTRADQASTNIRDATPRYEAWLRTRVHVVDDDLDYKHEAMRESCFAFLRATCCRWVDQFRLECSDLAGAPVVTAIGDLHL